MSAIPFQLQSVPGGPLILHRSGFITSTLAFTDSTGKARTLLVSAFILEQGVPDSRTGPTYPDASGGHLFPGAQVNRPLAYYQGLAQNPAGLTASIQVPPHGQSSPVQWVSAPLTPIGSVGGATGVLGVFWAIQDAQTGAQGNLWSPNVVNVEYS